MITLIKHTSERSVYDDGDTEGLLSEIQELIESRTPFEVAFSAASTLTDAVIGDLYRAWHRELSTGDRSWREDLSPEEASMASYWDEAASEASALMSQAEENLRRMMDASDPKKSHKK